MEAQQGKLLSCLLLWNNEPSGDLGSVHLGRAEETQGFGTQMLTALAIPCTGHRTAARPSLPQHWPPQHSSAPTHRVCTGRATREQRWAMDCKSQSKAEEPEEKKAALASFKTTFFASFPLNPL